MDIGSGIAIAAVCATIIAAILKFAPSSNGKHVAQELCDERSNNILRTLEANTEALTAFMREFREFKEGVIRDRQNRSHSGE